MFGVQARSLHRAKAWRAFDRPLHLTAPASHSRRGLALVYRVRTEFAVTMRALREFLPAPPSSVLDVGGGPGRYAIALSQQGYAVTLVDLAQGNIDFASAKAVDAGVNLPRGLVADARNLSGLADEAYDAVLLLGPLYHLLDRHSS